MSQISNLYRLQKTDSQMDQINIRLRQILEIISSDRSIINAEDALQEIIREEEKVQHSIKSLEEDLKILQIKAEVDESSLYSGKIINPKELKSLQEEIISLKKRGATLEDQILEVMDQLEGAEKSHSAAEINLKIVKGNFASHQASLLGEQSQLNKNLELLISEQKGIYGSISPEFQGIYTRLRKQKRGIAVSSLEDEACSACGSSPRPEEIQAAHSSEQITYCSSCGRILYAG